MSFTKRFFSVLMVAVLLLTVVPMNIGAEGSLATTGQCGDDVYWDFNESAGELVISGTGDMWDYISWENSSPFLENSSIETVIIEDGVTSIGDDAFCYIPYLSSVELPESITEIGYQAFAECGSLESIVIPEGVTSIGDSAFIFTPLNSVSIPSSIELIDSNAFYSCLLSDVYYSGTKEQWNEVSIGDYNDSLSDAVIHCTDGDVTYILTENDFVYKIDMKSGTACIEMYTGTEEDVVIPDTLGGYIITKIGDFAFEDNSHIKSVSIPETIEEIHYGAFFRCANLKKVYITDLTAWCNIQFHYFTANPMADDADLYLDGELVTDLVIPEGIEELNGLNFYGCTSIETVTIPATMKRIGWHVFSYCPNITDVYFEGSQSQWNEIEIDEANSSLLDAKIHYGAISEEPSTTEKEPVTTEKPAETTTKPTTTKPTTTKAPATTATTTTTKAHETTAVPTTKAPETTEKEEPVVKVKKPAKITVKKPKSAKKKQAVITWKKVKNANGYQITYSTSKKFTKKTTKSKLVKKAKTLKATLKKLKSGKKYFIKVRAYKTVNGKKLYGAYSKVMTVKVK